MPWWLDEFGKESTSWDPGDSKDIIKSLSSVLVLGFVVKRVEGIFRMLIAGFGTTVLQIWIAWIDQEELQP